MWYCLTGKEIFTKPGASPYHFSWAVGLPEFPQITSEREPVAVHLVLLDMPLPSEKFQSHWMLVQEIYEHGEAKYRIFQAANTEEMSYDSDLWGAASRQSATVSKLATRSPAFGGWKEKQQTHFISAAQALGPHSRGVPRNWLSERLSKFSGHAAKEKEARGAWGLLTAVHLAAEVVSQKPADHATVRILSSPITSTEYARGKVADMDGKFERQKRHSRRSPTNVFFEEYPVMFRSELIKIINMRELEEQSGRTTKMSKKQKQLQQSLYGIHKA